MIKLAVRKIVETVLRCGDFDYRFVDGSAMQEGVKAHRKVQRGWEKEWRKEVSLALETEIAGTPVLLQGRADGILPEEGRLTVNEIKTTDLSFERLYLCHEQHRGQALCYAYMYLRTVEFFPAVTVTLTYYRPETGETQLHSWDYAPEEVEAFFIDLLRQYGVWMRYEQDWRALRDASITKTDFPYPAYRNGQREMAAAVYRAVAGGYKLYAQAPTGIGKTLSALFPSVKAIGEGLCDKIFYLTAKTVTRRAAEDAVALMLEKGLRFKSLTLRAKDKICFTEEHICDPDRCLYSKGHYDRVGDALLDILNHNDLITPEVTAAYARRHTVCPHAFGLEIADWADLVVGDYNHVFDPTASLKRFFDDPGNEDKYVFLVDEAHNLADRIRDMYSAPLRKSAFYGIKKNLKAKDGAALKKAAEQMDAYLRDMKKTCDGRDQARMELDMTAVTLARQYFDAAGEWMGAHPGHPLAGAVTDLYFEVDHFLHMADLYDEKYTTLLEFEEGAAVTLFCLDPSAHIARGLSKARASILFSATMTPLPYYAELLGGDPEKDRVTDLPSPFPRENLTLLAHVGISTKYIDREGSYAPVTEAIYAAIQLNAGNWLAFFPSYSYMKRMYSLFTEQHPEVDILLQENEMDDGARAAFLARFDQKNAETLVGFCVLGGIFSEGIDLKGDRLIGAVIVGVGLPGISLRQNEIRDYWNRQNGRGFDYAYVYPGMNKVLQAAGRVIRTETDKGQVLLIDARFGTPQYKALYPAHWKKLIIEN